MLEVDFTADELMDSLTRLAARERVCILDSSGVGHLGSHLLLAGVRPVRVIENASDNANATLGVLDEAIATDLAAIFTLSYDFGEKLHGIAGDQPSSTEPDAFISLFDRLIIHDYDLGKTFIAGKSETAGEIAELLNANRSIPSDNLPLAPKIVRSNFSRESYMESVEAIREYIRSGDTYQANLTQQLSCRLVDGDSVEEIFRRLRKSHPAPFAAFLVRENSTVISASPERFFRVTRDGTIEASPIKGTRPRSSDPSEDLRLREELRTSEKDRAENTMIVDLMRNDLGRVCEYGSVRVGSLCEVEEHPTLYHLVSTVTGQLRAEVKFTDIIQALFPCGSITGAPKIRTMRIISEIEPSRRGLSMGTIGIHLPETWSFDPLEIDTVLDLSVAIRTMVVRSGEVEFNVGGGVVIDSDPEKEFDESMLKAKALLNALAASLE